MDDNRENGEASRLVAGILAQTMALLAEESAEKEKGSNDK